MLRFALQIFLSAFLLFQIQPIVARFILPDFGGASSVWTICLVFFQVLLLVGYLYAYLLDRWLPPLKQACVHGCLVFVAMVGFLPLNVGIVEGSPVQNIPQLGIVLLLITSVGMPYALVASSGPLFQNWFRSRYPKKDTYRLYALSNVGSLLGLLSYPFLIEPTFTLHQQSLFWSVGFAVYFFWTLACLWSLRNTKRTKDPVEQQVGEEGISKVDAVVWICMASIATILLLATTNKITMDVASVPFLWILPLTLYLLSFIICFDRPGWYDRRVWIPLLFVSTLFGAKALLLGANSSIYFQVGSYLAVLFVGCMVCHGELYRIRPPAILLTRYYLLISFGGAMGGVSVALIAPLVFSDYFELQLSWVAIFLIAGMCVFSSGHIKKRFLELGAQVAWSGWVVFLSFFLFFNSVTEKPNVLEKVRGFYGVLKLKNVELPDDHPSGATRYLSLMNGAITHGTQYFKNDHPLFIPTAYYSSDSGIGVAISAHPTSSARGLNVGVVGMGVATVSALCKSCESLSFYEIDPNVVAMERDWFSNLDTVRSAGVTTEVLVGDGRKLLESQLAKNRHSQYDVLAIDAFSGDAIPIHLLTREALDLYFKHLRADGVLALHVSNRHLDLAPVIASLASDLDYHAIEVVTKTSADRINFTSNWILVTNNDSFLAGIDSLESVTTLKPMTGYSWTDEYSNLLNVLR